MSFPNDSQYTSVPLGSSFYFDVTGDESPAAVDLVGNSSNPSFGIAYDDKNVYFRLRLNDDPRNRQKTGFQNFAWGVLINTGGQAGTYQWLLAVDGMSGELVLIENTKQEVNSWNDPAEGTDGRGKPNFSQPIVNFDIARITPAGTTFGGNENVFLDFFIPAATLFDFLNITKNTPLQLISFTSTNSNNYNKDSLRFSEGFQFTNAFSDPISVEDTNVKAKLDLQKILLSGPTTVNAGDEAAYSARLVLENTGQSKAATVKLQDVIKFDLVSGFSITSSSTGKPYFNEHTNTLSWEIGVLPPGETAVLDFEVSGYFTTAGERVLERAKAIGTDGNTGARILSDIVTTTIDVTSTGGITGIVKNHTNGLPLADVVVELKDGATTIGVTTTNDRGEYSLNEIPPGSYTIEYSKPDFITNIQSVNVVSGEITRKDVFLTELPGSIEGTVTNSVGGAIANATVLLIDSAGNVIDEKTTNASGEYSFPSVKTGSYTIVVSATGFQSAEKGVIVEGNKTSTANFVLEPNPGNVQGTVTNEAGDPISGALVEVLNVAGTTIGRAVTNASGAYAISDLAPGDYKLRVSKDLYRTSVVGFNVEAGETKTLNVELISNPGALEGTVTDATTSDPLQGTTVQVVDARGVTVASALTDGSGFYQVENLSPGMYSVTFVSGGYGLLTVGTKIVSNQTTELNVALDQLVGGIAGTITDNNGNTLSGAIVEVFFNNVHVVTATTDNNGVYKINNLSPGFYTLNVSKTGFSTETVGASVVENEISEANATLLPNPGTVTGTVLTSSGDPISGAVINIRDDRTGAEITQAVTNEQGAYTALGLAPGNYTIIAQAEDFQSQFKGATIVSDQTTIVDFSMLPNPSSVSGTIINAEDGLPITGSMIEIQIIDAAGSLVTTAFTNLDGEYEVNDLTPGTFSIIASATDFQTNSATVSLLPGELKVVNIELTPAPGNIVGTITDISGNPLSNVSIRIVNAQGLLVGTILTDSEGMYVFNGLAPGNYTVTAIASGFQSSSAGAIIEPNETTVVNQSLESNPGSISGTVTPLVDGTTVTLRTADDLFVASTLINEAGDFTFDNLLPGQYILSATASNYRVSTAGATVVADEITFVDLTLVPNPSQISGVITNPDGTPVSSATVQIIDLNGSVLSSGTTDQSGEYVISNLPPGSFTVVVSAQDFASTTGGITLDPGQIVTDANFVLIPDPGTIVGQVVDPSGNAISGATVIIRTFDNTQVRTLTTNEFGEFLVGGIAPGSYTVTATAPNFSTEFVGALVTSNENTVANLVLESLVGNISGSVVDEDGNLITGDNIGIKLFSVSGALLQSFVANSDGSFFINALNPGQYKINATAPNYSANTVSADVIAGATETITVPLQLLPATITGRIINSATGDGINGAVLTFTTSEGIPIATSTSGLDGEYIVENIPAGSVVVSVIASDFGARSLTTVVEPGEVKSLTIELDQSLGFLTGYITNIDTGEAIAAAITLIDENGEQIAIVTSDDSGQFLTEGLTPGNYQAVAAAEGFTSRTASFSIVSNETSVLSFALSPIPGTITGRITNFNTGDPISGSTIVVHEQSPSGPIVATTITNANGEYIVNTLAASTYTIVAFADDFGAAEATTVVGRGETKTVDIRLVPDPGAIQGTIKDANTGLELSGISVDLYNEDGMLVFTTNTDENGFYQFTELAALQYRIVTRNPDFQTQEVGVIVTSGNTELVNLNLESNPGSITGTIVDAETNTRLVGAEVTAFVAQDIVPIATVITNSLGEYTISGLVPGSYTIVANAVSYTENSTGSTVSPNETTITDLSLTSNPASLSGTVLDENGQPLKNAVVKIIDINGVVIGISAVDENGFYSIGGLRPGTYRILASAPATSAPDVGGASTGLTLMADQNRTANFVLRNNPGSVSGMVFDEDTGAPIVGANINILDSNGQVVATTTSTTGGSYLVNGLTAGSYTVSVFKTSYARKTAGAIVEPDQTTTVDFFLKRTTGSIFGKLQDDAGHQIDSDSVGIRLLDEKGLLLQSTVATPDCEFSFSDLPPGQYLVSISANGYQSKAVPVTVASGEVSELTITLFKNAGIVSGSVTNMETSTGIAGASITIKDASNITIATGLTNEDGNFTVDNIPPGPQVVTASRDGFGTGTTGVNVVENEVSEVSIALTPNPGSISGVITDEATGLPVSNANVQVLNDGGTVIATVLTQSDGQYLAADIRSGVYEVIVSHPDYGIKLGGAIVESNERTTLDLALSSSPGSLSGIVINQETKERVSGASVELRWLSPDGELIASTLTNDNGEYSIKGLTPAIYTVVGFGAGLGSDLASIEIRPNQMVVQNLGLFPLPSNVRGNVTDATTGLPIEDVLVRLVTSSGGFLQRAQTDSSGNYLIEGFDPGEYALVVRNEQYASAAKGFTGEPLQTEEVNFALQSNPGSVTGRVKSMDTSQFVSGVSVIVLDDNNVPIANTLTDGSGVYLIKGLAPGRYSIRALAIGCDSNAKAMTIIAGETTTIDFLLTGDPSIVRGNVTDTDGNVLNDVGVTAFDSNGNVVGRGITSREGVYVIGYLPAETLTLVATLPGFAPDTKVVTLTPSSDRTVNFVLSAVNPGKLIGRVTSERTGDPIVGATLAARRNDEIVAEVSTGPDGTYSMELPAGEYVIFASAPSFETQEEPIVISEGETVELNFALQGGTPPPQDQYYLYSCENGKALTVSNSLVPTPFTLLKIDKKTNCGYFSYMDFGTERTLIVCLGCFTISRVN
ncbi:carboxypeptidase regulatory-like domain-containing protein [Guptibacillus algicola]|uniref:carboxypeptidase regulatory-like domain-containing protein n=1 Tax=Guptibacillus algicola TaxID=225844 RepID=UPI001CD298E6|nr:carboxypeptidase regulatory-like domain-containing protein [Alkalihalobacillus algicola]MCA0989644.1 carboxypeptidase regulatory-like domain-containing protein [Alkalihalobacillus algicola]